MARHPLGADRLDIRGGGRWRDHAVAVRHLKGRAGIVLFSQNGIEDAAETGETGQGLEPRAGAHRSKAKEARGGQVEKLAGTPVGEGKAGVMERGASSCSFTGAHGGQIIVPVRRVPSGDWRHEQVARMRGGAYREVQGIGERSFLYTLRGNAVLCVFASEYYLQISARRIEGSPPVVSKLGERAITALAQLDSGRHLALARMGPR